MTFDPNDVLRRFHRALVREIQATNPELLSSPFSVAEIYQNLVPYRTHRDEIGVEMNADYEHALLRLLAGESDFLTIESRTARQEIREELEAPNPNTALYRDFAAADVRLNPQKIDEALMGDVGRVGAGGPDSPAEDSTEDPEEQAEPSNEGEGALPEEDAGGGEGMDETSEVEEVSGTNEGEGISEVLDEVVEAHLVAEVDPEEVPVEVSGEVSGEDVAWPSTSEEGEEEGQEAGPLSEEEEEEMVSPPTSCAWCREELPDRPGVNFCPFCGCSVNLVPCPECGEELELKWRFCIACGTEVSQ
jgi:hypothetical protein